MTKWVVGGGDKWRSGDCAVRDVECGMCGVPCAVCCARWAMGAGREKPPCASWRGLSARAASVKRARLPLFVCVPFFSCVSEAVSDR